MGSSLDFRVPRGIVGCWAEGCGVGKYGDQGWVLVSRGGRRERRVEWVGTSMPRLLMGWVEEARESKELHDPSTVIK